MCPDGVVAYHESLSSFRPGSESRSGRFITCKQGHSAKGLNQGKIMVICSHHEEMTQGEARASRGFSLFSTCLSRNILLAPSSKSCEKLLNSPASTASLASA